MLRNCRVWKNLRRVWVGKWTALQTTHSLSLYIFTYSPTQHSSVFIFISVSILFTLFFLIISCKSKRIKMKLSRISRQIRACVTTKYLFFNNKFTFLNGSILKWSIQWKESLISEVHISCRVRAGTFHKWPSEDVGTVNIF